MSNVAVEKAVHEAFREVVERIWTQHGVRVDRVAFDWITVPRLGLPTECKLVQIAADTVTRY